MRHSESVEIKPYYYPGAGNNNAIRLFPLCWGENKEKDWKQRGWKKWMYKVTHPCVMTLGAVLAQRELKALSVPLRYNTATRQEHIWIRHTQLITDNIEQLMFAQYSVIVQLGVFNWASPTTTTPQKSSLLLIVHWHNGRANRWNLWARTKALSVFCSEVHAKLPAVKGG